ncbi:MAG TPA: NAD(P)/FAD-dependent oxidoreductase [Bacteroidota bacterium]|nr:NAD(P)/FAD-dependent oxidoreductase [Bacteroidota bacterium]
MAATQKKRILILGGGFGGLYAALELEKSLRNAPGVEITLVSRENYFLFTPLLHEVAASDLDVTHTVNPLRLLLKRARFFNGEVKSIDLDRRCAVVSHGAAHHRHELPYDHLLIALGSVTNFRDLPGEENAITMRSLGDAILLRNRLITLLEAADFDCAPGPRDPLLTVVVAGGGFAGVETVAAINDFFRGALKRYPNVREEMIHLALVHAGEYILPELGQELGAYARRKLAGRGVEVRTQMTVSSYRDGTVVLSDGTRIPAETLIWTAGIIPNPLLAGLPCEKDRGRIVVDSTLEVPAYPGVWAIGDCARVPEEGSGSSCPPTAQHALRQGRIAGRNIAARVNGGTTRAYVYSSIGALAAIGHRCGVARIFGVNFSGFLAWWMWRTVYLGKLPRFEKKFRVALDWTLDLVFGKDLVQFESRGEQ